MMLVSIVVCTYKRYDLVQNCLRHVSKMKIPTGVSYEVIVVENTPAKYRQSLDWVTSFPHARVAIENETGLSAARNNGIRESHGEIISFLDDDAEPFPNWLEEISTAFANIQSALVIGGKVIPKFPGAPRPEWISKKCEEFLSCIDWGDETKQIVAGKEWLVGANISYRREAFEVLGNFGTKLGRKGEATLLSNEESEFNSRIPAVSQYYCGKAVVNHLIPDDRLDRDWFRKRAFWQAISDAMAGNVTSEAAAGLFEDYKVGLLQVPAENRCAKSLFYEANSQDEFSHQLNQIYRQTVALSLGKCTW